MLQQWQSPAEAGPVRLTLRFSFFLIFVNNFAANISFRSTFDTQTGLFQEACFPANIIDKIAQGEDDRCSTRTHSQEEEA